ncbi:pentatricopeptide repeat-containing protein At2g22410, mitochondrial-like [Papaver somniferum]|uniref:pentatricopeptide repeat-containing protein At2g22410, mitochondrial-like n=1 Tax=Papaver somniferum TaxID=3469 RepID=UPI000E70345D|nr:pentatricopeptide repeat-containing protein At2g22410, mitochondrial-like [Papaver somniferum]XP_026387993.1 pentatricopeptide repeat-containing protein At2g22410, mitochondrial-like [Papaver somniferum]XP_026387994.1 pentatricopeptide repeat-containing protein At2g22410, mitochondrial-like [Papaver somniferum]XP_026387995.1 pentatricopeptide repeat-containing protein At2g22410, mitochondrial-like [Papaver somniferum]
MHRLRVKVPCHPPLRQHPEHKQMLQTQFQWLLEKCKSVEEVNPILSNFVVSGLIRQSFYLCKLVEVLAQSQNSTLLLYSRLLLEHQSNVFRGEEDFNMSPSTTTFLWNTIIRGYSRSRFPQQGITTYRKMLQNSCKPDNFTFPIVIKAASSMQEGVQVHGQIVSNGFEFDIFVVNTVLSMYTVFGDLKSAQRLFETSPNLDIVSWNTLIDGYVKSGAVELARSLFDKMTERNEITWTAMISGYAKTGNMDIAQSLFDRMPIRRSPVTWNSMISGFAKCGFVPLARKMFDEMPLRNIASWNAMISSYAQSGKVELARSLFDKMPEKDVISWSCMISGYAQNGRGRDALGLFKKLEESKNCIRPNEVTLVSVLSVCGNLAALEQGKWVHVYIERNGMRLNDNLGAALVDMYAKCGCVGTAVEIFWKLVQKNVSTWNALITGFAVNGAAQEALKLFEEMLRSKEKPDSITFLGVLMACCHGGLVEEGLRHFRSMSKNYGIQPEIKHYGCVVDLLGRAGLLDEAQQMVRSMPMKPDVMVLGALLGACRIHGSAAIADALRKEFLLERNPEEAGCQVLLSNIYATAVRWGDASDMRSEFNSSQIKKNTGFSAVESLGI